MGVMASKTRPRVLPSAGRRTRSISFASSTAATTTISVPETVSSAPSKSISEILAGATARIASQVSIHPLDTLKVRMQTTVKNAKNVKGIGKPLPAVHRMARNVLTLYRGVLGAAAGAGFGLGTYFVLYTTARNVMTRRTKMNSGSIAFVSAGTAALSCSVLKVPLSVSVRSVQAGIYKDALTAIVSIVKAVGVRGLFTGYLPTIMEDVPDMAVKFAVYETLRSVHKTVFIDRQPTAQEDFAMGAISGALAAACTTPVDVIKTNMMCEAVNRPSMLAVAGNLMKTQGPMGFFKGVGPRALSNGINSAMFFCFFEAFRSIIAKKQCQYMKTLRSTEDHHNG